VSVPESVASSASTSHSRSLSGASASPERSAYAAARCLTETEATTVWLASSALGSLLLDSLLLLPDSPAASAASSACGSSVADGEGEGDGAAVSEGSTSPKVSTSPSSPNEISSVWLKVSAAAVGCAASCSARAPARASAAKRVFLCIRVPFEALWAASFAHAPARRSGEYALMRAGSKGNVASPEKR
jgi:hypothetical protein